MEESKADKILSAVLTIQGQVTILQGQMKTTQGQIGTMQNQIETMQGQIGTMQNQIERMQGQIETTQNQIERMQGQIETTQNQIERMQGQMLTKQDLEIEFAKFKKEFGKLLKGTIDEMQQDIDENREEVRKLPCISLKSKLKKFVSRAN